MTKLQRYNNTGSPRFVTFSCFHNYNILKTEVVKDLIVDNIGNLRQEYGFKLFGYVVMPNHVHLVMLPPDDLLLSRIIGHLKSVSARAILSFWRSQGLQLFEKLKVTRDGKSRYALWQRRYYDHNCRTRETTREKITYCHNNPVKKGLVEEPGDWRWSSYRWYHGMVGVLLEMDVE